MFGTRHRIQRIQPIQPKRRSELQLGPSLPHAPGVRMTGVKQTPSNYDHVVLHSVREWHHFYELTWLRSPWELLVAWHGTWYQVPGTWYQVLGTWYQVPAKYLVLGTSYQVLGTWYQVLGAEYSVIGTRFRVNPPWAKGSAEE